MTIVGRIVSDGAVNIFGRMEGELRASDVLIGDAAQFEGSIVAQELTVRGHVKGNIHAVRVRLDSTAKVEGEIFHRSLSIEENALFEGSSRRQENPTDTTSGVQAKANGQEKANGQDKASVQENTPKLQLLLRPNHMLEGMPTDVFEPTSAP